MPTVEITRPTTIRELLFEERSDTEIAVELAVRLPADGLAARALSRERHLPKSVHRLLSSRITRLAVQFLDQDLAGLIVSGLGTVQELVQAAEETRAQRTDEVTVPLAGPYRFTAGQKPYVEVLVDGTSQYKVTFDLEVAVELGETAVVVRGGEMTAIDCTAAALEVTFTVEEWTEPLVRRQLSVPVRLTLEPPVSLPVGRSVPVMRPPLPPVPPPAAPSSRRPPRPAPR